MRPNADGPAAGPAGALRMEVFRRVTAPIWLVLGAVLAAAILAKTRLDLPWYFVMGDPATATGRPFFVGFVSNVGVVMWASIATVFLFRHHVERAIGGRAEWRRFLLWSGLFAGVLGLDDLFLLHDQVFPDYLGVSQSLVVGLYAVLCLGYLLRFSGQIARTAYPVFIAALGLLAASVALDQLQDRWEIYLPASGFLEDAAKLLGIGTWLSYALHTCATLPLPARGTVRRGEAVGSGDIGARST